jgi:hypothetical protein
MLRCGGVRDRPIPVVGGTDEALDIMFRRDHSVMRAEPCRRAASSRFVGHDGNYLQFWDGEE